MTKEIPTSQSPLKYGDNGRVERRVNASDRRQSGDRRSHNERRTDRRVSSVKGRKSIKAWFRSLFHARLGVDRRKVSDRRRMGDRRKQSLLRSILTREEIEDLLS